MSIRRHTITCSRIVTSCATRYGLSSRPLKTNQITLAVGIAITVALTNSKRPHAARWSNTIESQIWLRSSGSWIWSWSWGGDWSNSWNGNWGGGRVSCRGRLRCVRRLRYGSRGRLIGRAGIRSPIQISWVNTVVTSAAIISLTARHRSSTISLKAHKVS